MNTTTEPTPIEYIGTHGFRREDPLSIFDPIKGEFIMEPPAPYRVFWWWDSAFQKHYKVVHDDEPEPEFIPAKTPFIVTHCTEDRIEWRK